MRVSQPLCAILALTLSACSQPPRDAQADWAHGARRAWVVEAAAPALSRAALPACVQELPAEVLAARRFVMVRYWHGRRSFIEIAEAPAGMPLRVGDQVELLPEACAQGRPARIARVLAALGN